MLFTAADKCIQRLSSVKRKFRIKSKRKAYKKAQYTKTEEDFREFRRISNQVRNMMRKDHRTRIEDIAMNFSNDQCSCLK